MRNNEGCIVRPQGRPPTAFSVVPDTILRDRSLTPRARLVLAYVAGRPQNWTITVGDLTRSLGLSNSTWHRTRDELRQAGIIPSDHPKRLGGGVNPFTWILDLDLLRYYLSTEPSTASHRWRAVDN